MEGMRNSYKVLVCKVTGHLGDQGMC